MDHHECLINISNTTTTTTTTTTTFLSTTNYKNTNTNANTTIDVDDGPLPTQDSITSNPKAIRMDQQVKYTIRLLTQSTPTPTTKTTSTTDTNNNTTIDVDDRPLPTQDSITFNPKAIRMDQQVKYTIRLLTQSTPTPTYTDHNPSPLPYYTIRVLPSDKPFYTIRILSHPTPTTTRSQSRVRHNVVPPNHNSSLAPTLQLGRPAAETSTGADQQWDRPTTEPTSGGTVREGVGVCSHPPSLAWLGPAAEDEGVTKFQQVLHVKRGLGSQPGRQGMGVPWARKCAAGA
jgi:hypothetical protein